ncbi:MAG: PASTA domain-containing protein, partial [Pseudomonadota bacterium]
SATVLAGNVISQDPAGGTAATLGSAVDIVVSLGPVQVVVPNVVNFAQATAETTITGQSLTVGTITTANSLTVAAGNVISQTPIAGATVDEGSPVDLVVSLGPVQVTVPDVVGQAQATAEFNLTAADLTVGTVSQASSATVPAGNVISQSPGAGSIVDEQSAVDLLVSTGPALIVVPDVSGLTQTAAEAQITVAGLTPGAVTFEASGTVAAGLVIRTDPAAGTSVGAAATVDIVISSGPAPVNVPDVTGFTQSGAQTAIEAAGLVVGTLSQENSDTVGAGLVIRTSPAAGASAAVGSAVDIVISLGPVSGSQAITTFIRTLPPGQKNEIQIYQKNDVVLVFTVQDFDQKPVNVTNYTGRFVMTNSRHSQSARILDASAQIYGSPDDGQMAITINRTQTLRTGRDYYEFIVTDPDGNVTTVSFGLVRWVRTLNW